MYSLDGRQLQSPLPRKPLVGAGPRPSKLERTARDLGLARTVQSLAIHLPDGMRLASLDLRARLDNNDGDDNDDESPVDTATLRRALLRTDPTPRSL